MAPSSPAKALKTLHTRMHFVQTLKPSSSPRDLMVSGIWQLAHVVGVLDELAHFDDALDPLKFLLNELKKLQDGYHSAVLDEGIRMGRARVPTRGDTIKDAQMLAAVTLEAAIRVKISKKVAVRDIANICNGADIRGRFRKIVTPRAVADWRDRYKKKPALSKAYWGDTLDRRIALQQEREEWPETEKEVRAYIRALPSRIKGLT